MTDTKNNLDSRWIVKQSSSQEVNLKSKMSELVMAWAQDKDTFEPRYILELNKSQRGAACNCVCVSCNMPLIAVNAAKSECHKRPHFRHVQGVESKACLVLSARYAINQQLQLLEKSAIELPRRWRTSQVTGLSGQIYSAWVEVPPEKVKIKETCFLDKATALLTLEDGRKLRVILTGSLSQVENNSDEVIPTIMIDVDDPSVASLSPNELRERLRLLWAGACWSNHWQDNQQDEKALYQAREQAKQKFDFVSESEVSDEFAELTIPEKRETLLHREVKEILQREKRINIPKYEVKIQKETPFNELIKKEKIWRSGYLELDNVLLEKRHGRIVPDVIAEVVHPSNLISSNKILIEVTVTNTINEERLARIQNENMPVLEIDISRLGGVVTRDQLVELVVDELAIKRWLHHPEAQDFAVKTQEDASNLIESMSGFLTESLKDNVRGYIDSYVEFTNARILDFEKNYNFAKERDAKQKFLNAANTLSKLGYPEALDKELYTLRGNLLDRILSIKLDKGVGYRLNTGWQVINAIFSESDSKYQWHTLYLIAIKQYKPRFNEKQNERYAEWRHDVLQSIQNGESTFIRDTKFDRFISLLFPELAEAISKQLGKLNEKEKIRDTSAANKSNTDMSQSYWLKGNALEEWKVKYPESAKKWFG